MRLCIYVKIFFFIYFLFREESYKIIVVFFFRKEYSWRLLNSVIDNSRYFVFVEIEFLFF